MRINFSQTNRCLQPGLGNPGFRKNVFGNGQPQGNVMRSDTAALSPQGKAASRLANLMSQKELIQMNKDSLLKRALDDESGAGSAGMKEQLEEYEEQLDVLNEQIASEMAKQAEETEKDNEKDTAYQKPQNTPPADSLEDSIDRITELSADLDMAKISNQANVRREGEEYVCKAEIKQGSTAAKRKLEKIRQMERYTGAYAPILKKLH